MQAVQVQASSRGRALLSRLSQAPLRKSILEMFLVGSAEARAGTGHHVTGVQTHAAVVPEY